MNYIKLATVPILASLMLSVATAYGDDKGTSQPTANSLQPLLNSLLDFLIPTGTSERTSLQEEQDLQRYAQQQQEAKNAEIQQQKELEQQQANELEQREQERIRINKLRAGQIPITNINDAVNYYDAKSVHNIMVSPLLTADRKAYGGVVTIDQQQDTGNLLVKIENGMSLLSGYPVNFEIAYAELKLDSKTKDFATMPLRVGGQIRFVGQYLGNVKYSTVIGSSRSMPILRVRYMDGIAQGYMFPVVRPE